MRLVSRRAAAAGLLAASTAAASLVPARADGPFRLRVSLDTSPSHGRNLAFGDYLKKLEAASDGRIKPELFPSGQLYADLTVTKALIQGEVEMAAPGVWALTNFIQDADIFQLPALYNQPVGVIHRVTDGRAGGVINAEVELKLRSHVLGPWLDNGFSNWFSTRKPLNSLADLKGLKIRNSGGGGQSWRTQFFGGIPNVTPWPNVPMALAQGTFDGLITTDDSVVSVTLWESGVRYGFEDHNFFGAYVPMVSNVFWTQLPLDLRTVMTRLWAENIGGYRAAMAASQARARGTLENHGVTIVDQTPQDAVALRTRMLAEQDQVAAMLKVSPEIVRLMMQDIGGAV
jgi:TRAP-type C4-dicarboxylate transport system substrate-binding protein